MTKYGIERAGRSNQTRNPSSQTQSFRRISFGEVQFFFRQDWVRPITALSSTAHLLPNKFGEYTPAFGLKQDFGVGTPKDVEKEGCQAGPPRRGPARPRPIIPVEVLIKQDQVAPVRVFLEFSCSRLDRPSSTGVAQECTR